MRSPSDWAGSATRSLAVILARERRKYRSLAAVDLKVAAADLADRIIRNAPLAVEAVKELALRALDLPWEPVSRLSDLYRALIGTTEDAKEGPRAFVEKREPVYRGR